MDWSLLTNFAAAMIALINPLGNLPIFISYTAGERLEVRRWLALLVAMTVLVLLMIFLTTGQSILAFFGVSLSAFRIAGGILLLLIGLNMVQGHQTNVNKEVAAQAYSNNLKEAEYQYRKIIVPLGIPLFVGPGSISTVILYAGKAHNQETFFGLMLVIFVVSLLVLFCLLSSESIKKVLGETGLDVGTRILGLILAAMGVQFILGGLADATLNFINPQVL